MNMKSSKVKKVYVAEYNGNYKIGVSNNVYSRMGQLSCGCPTIKSIYESDFLSNAFEIESLLHNKYKDKNIGGEWFSGIDIREIEDIITRFGEISDYEKCRKEENEKAKEDAKNFSIVLKKYFDGVVSTQNINIDKQDDRNMTAEELRYENEQIEKFAVAINGADIPNIYSDLIYDILFGKSTEQLVSEYKTNRFESFRKYLSYKQNDTIEKYTRIIGDMINAYWTFDKIKDYMEMI